MELGRADSVLVHRALEVKSSHESELFSKANVIGVDVGFKYVSGERTNEVAIRIFVSKKEEVETSNFLPRSLDGIKTDVIMEEMFVPITQVPQADQALPNSNRYDPLVGGISVGPTRSINRTVYTGTLGAIVQKAGEIFSLSNFHVYGVNDGWSKGDEIAQPSRVDAGKCPRDNIGKIEDACLGNKLSGKETTVDAAIATIENRQASNENASILNIGVVRGSAEPVLGQIVRKQGRTTGLTHGFVDGLGGTVNVDYGGTLGMVCFTNQIQIMPDTSENSSYINGGDSGSVSVNDNNEIIGLNFARSRQSERASANVFSDVKRALGVDTLPAWKSIGGALSQVSAGSGSHVWGINPDGELVHRENDAWTMVEGALTLVSSGSDGAVWGLDAEGSAFKREENNWVKMGGQLSQISVGSESHIWGVSIEGDVFKRNEEEWVQVDGSLTQVSVGSDGSVWGVNSSGEVFRRDDSAWTQIEGQVLSQISVGSEGKVWGLTDEGEIFKRESESWKKMPVYLSSISVASDNSVWGIGRENRIWEITG
ncbi:MAG: hypothetical protein ACI9S8_001582 [Chlamydiales bacterium]|jgi:hypothetical protein